MNPDPTVWITVYDLADDAPALERMAQASRTGTGLAPTLGVIGTREWWAAVGTAELPFVIVKGELSGLRTSGHNDYPEFGVETTDGATHWFARNAEDVRYRLGARVRVALVEPLLSQEWPVIGNKSRVVVKIQISE